MAAKLRRYKIASLILVLTFSTIIMSSSVASSRLTVEQTIAFYGQINESTSANTLSVNGTHIINGLGQTIYLRGLNLGGLDMPVATTILNGFESGNFSAWNCPTSGSATIVTSPVYSGNYAAKFVSTTSAVAYAEEYFGSGGGCTALNLSCYVQMATLPSSGDEREYFQLFDTGYACVFQVGIYNNGGTYQVLAQDKNYNWYLSNGQTLSANTWYYLQAYLLLGTSSNGTITVWLNGQQVINQTNITTSTGNNISEILVGNLSTSEASTVFIDDVVVTNANVEYGSLITENDFAVMASMGANCVRIPFAWGYLEPQVGVYNMAYVARLDQVIGWAESNNLYVILSLQNSALQYPYMASWITDPGFFTNASQQQSFIDVWTWLSQRYMNDPMVLYDLMNEPSSPALVAQLGWDAEAAQLYPVMYNSSGLYTRTIQAIRANGDDKICIVQQLTADPWMGAGSIVGTDGVTYPIKLADPNVLYSPHLYAPANSGDDMSEYNSLVNSIYQFSVDNNVPIFVGEWGIPWMDTTLSVTEQTYWTQEHCQTYANLGFNWCYWSFKEDGYAIYYSNEWSGIFNDTLRPMASVLTEYMSETAILSPP